MMTSIGEIPTAAAQIYGNKTLLVCEDRSLSFGELDALSNRLASALLDLGVQVGDRVTLYSANCWEWVVSYYGILKTGAVVNPINVMLTPSKVEFIANDCGASIVIASLEKAMSIQNVKERSNVRELIAFGDEPLPDGCCRSMRCWTQLMIASRYRRSIHCHSLQSGTRRARRGTKGACLSHQVFC